MKVEDTGVQETKNPKQQSENKSLDGDGGRAHDTRSTAGLEKQAQNRRVEDPTGDVSNKNIKLLNYNICPNIRTVSSLRANVGLNQK